MIVFSAFQLTNEAADAAEKLQGILKERTAGSFPPRENLHITVLYYGETEEARIKDLHALLEAHPLPSAELCFDRLLRFGGRKGDHIVYSCGECAELTEWHTRLCEDTRAAGFRFDAKPYVPHITLVRGKQGRIETEDINVPSVILRPQEAVLFESLSIRGKRIYRRIG